MSESLDITINGKADFSNIDKEFERIANKGKKGFKFWGKGEGSLYDKGKKARKKIESASKYAGTKYGSGSGYANKLGADGSDLDETGSGGFFNTLEKKYSAAKDLIAKKKKKKGEDLDEEEGKGSFSPLGNLNTQKPVSVQKAEFKIQHANFDKGGLGGNGTGGGGGSGGGDNSGGNVRGSGFSAMGMAIPVAGALFAIAGGVLKTISAIGEQYHASMQSQATTIGATGGYVGGGGGLFSNSELAQANVIRGRVTGADIFGKGNAIDSETMKFAASQGKGISEVVKELETIRKDSKNADLGFLRGGAKASGFSNLRQGEYITKLANIAENLRAKGYSGDISDYSKFSAGISRSDGKYMDGSRRLGLAEELSNQGRSGAFGGGIFGSLSMAHALNENGGDIFQAIRDSEANPGKYMSSALSSLDPNTRGIIHKMSGGSYSEMSALNFGYGDFAKDNSSIHAGYNKGLELDNKKKETFATDIGQNAAQIGYDLNNGMLNIFKENKEVMLKLTNVVSGIEAKLLPVVSNSVGGIATGIEKLIEYTGPVLEKLGTIASVISPAGLLIRPK
ncbi:hypothetical protein [Leptospira sanjuanensis]|uniref:hypothetical protein n=1 Tax=Leptospira sanjuanensis TaxID=2879643 RepID=UPI001EE8E050|nr:hypothetical protein [Leptospira sanjuanensis]MCG6170224.1 hypothetical protein [Leptospira sanjuanensis]